MSAPKRKPPAKPERRKCVHVTRTGNKCKYHAIDGSDRCRRHQPASTPAQPPEPWDAFLTELEQCGMVTEAARRVGIHKQRAYEHRNLSKEFADAWDEIVEKSVELMEREAYRRAVVGTQRPVFHDGLEVGAIREYSDTLLIFLLKARRPDTYRERHQVEHTGTGGGPVEHAFRLSPEGLRELTDDELEVLRKVNQAARDRGDRH